MHADTRLHPCPIDVCVDCLTVLANGVDDGADDVTALEVAAERLADLWPGDTPQTTPAVTLGRIGDDPDTDPVDDPSFSWEQCDGCGSTEGGDRHPATGWYDPKGLL